MDCKQTNDEVVVLDSEELHRIGSFEEVNSQTVERDFMDLWNILSTDDRERYEHNVLGECLAWIKKGKEEKRWKTFRKFRLVKTSRGSKVTKFGNPLRLDVEGKVVRSYLISRKGSMRKLLPLSKSVDSHPGVMPSGTSSSLVLGQSRMPVSVSGLMQSSQPSRRQDLSSPSVDQQPHSDTQRNICQSNVIQLSEMEDWGGL